MTSSSIRRAGVVALATVVAVLAAAAAAGATTLVRYFPPGQPVPSGVGAFGLRLDGDSSSEGLSVRFLDSPFRFRVAPNFVSPIPGATLVAGSGCSAVSGGVECPEAGSLQVTAILGDGPDFFTADTLQSSVASNEAITVASGAGNNQISGGPGQDLLQGGPGNDMISGFGGNDQLYGNGGNDTLDGGDGNDMLVGGLGADKFFGGAGNDTIDARDGVKDTSVDCGAGTDTVLYDLQDSPTFLDPKALALFRVPTTNCETILTFATDDGPPSRGVGNRLAIDRNGSARPRIACPSDAGVACHGRVSILDPKGFARLASASYNVPMGATRSVRVRLSKRQRALLRRRGQALVVTQEQGHSSKGPRSSTSTLKVA